MNACMTKAQGRTESATMAGRPDKPSRPSAVMAAFVGLIRGCSAATGAEDINSFKDLRFGHHEVLHSILSDTAAPMRSTTR